MKTLLLILILTVSQNIFAQSSTEGLGMTLNQSELDALRNWTEDTKRDLEYLKSRASATEGTEEKIAIYRQGLKTIVSQAEGINASGMRKVLNRAIHLEYLVDSSQRRGPKGRRFRHQLFSQSVNLALRVYQSDIQFIESGARKDNEFIRLQSHFFNTIKDLATDSNSKINDYPFTQIKIAMAGFLNRDVFESPYRQAAAYEIERINRIVSLGTNANEADLTMLDGLVNSMMNHIPAITIGSSRSLDSIPAFGVSSVPNCILALQSSGMSQSYSTNFCSSRSNRNHQKVSCIAKLRQANMSQSYSYNFCSSNARDTNTRCIERMRAAGFSQSYSYNFCSGNPSETSVDCATRLLRSGISQSYSYNSCR